MNSLPKLKILYIGPIPIEAGGEENGGVATHCLELAREASRRGNDVFVLSNPGTIFHIENGSLLRLPILHDINLPQKYLRALKTFFAFRGKMSKLSFLSFEDKVITCYLAYTFKCLVEFLNPDVIHILHILGNANFALSCLDHPPPTVTSEYGAGLLHEQNMHALFGVNNKDYSLKKVTEAVSLTDRIVSSSDFSRISFIKTFGLRDSSKIETILLPLNPDTVVLSDRNEAKAYFGIKNEPVILFCGVSLPVKRKGLDILLTAVRNDEFLRTECKLLIVTNKEGESYTEQFVTERGLDYQVHVSLPRKILEKAYNAADIFVMPSRQEGIGLVYYESLLAGVPVVGYSNSVVELERETNLYIGEGFDAATESPEDLADKIKRVLGMKLDRKLLRAAIADNLSWDIKFQDFDQVYRKVITERMRNKQTVMDPRNPGFKKNSGDA